MSVSVNQLIMTILNPFMLGMLSVFLSLLAAIGKLRRTGKILIGLSFVWLWVWSSGWWYNSFGSHLEAAFPQVPVETIKEPIDIIHILGGGVGINTNDCLQTELWAGADRVWKGAQMCKAHPEALVVCSGGSLKESTLPLLHDFGIVTNRIVLLEQAQNTEDEARRVGCVARSISSYKGRLPRIALVTSVWHMRRAKFLFDQISGCTVVPVPCDYECTTDFGPSHRLGLTDFIPNAQWMFRNCYLAKEYIAYWGYRIKYRK